jgi:hypothetical protein
MLLTNLGGTTTGFTLDFLVSDTNSCVNAAAGSEITGFELNIQRSSSVCDPTAASYDPNNCYPSALDSAVWNLNCTASSTSCTGPTDETQLFNCTFPLWFLADPTDEGPNTPAAFSADNWVAVVAGADDNFATSTFATSTNDVDVISVAGLDLITAVIPYGALAPGDNSGTLSTTTTVLNIGNTGLDQEVDGSAMCPTFISSSTDCSLNGTSTIFTSNQEFAVSAVAYGTGANLPTTTDSLPSELELDVNKSVSTSSPAQGDTYWGIAVPNAVSVAGAYTGLNTFYAVIAENVDW